MASEIEADLENEENADLGPEGVEYLPLRLWRKGVVFALKEAKDLARKLRVKYDAELLDSAFTSLKMVY